MDENFSPMDRINRITGNQDYHLHLLKNKTLEEQRVFCRHDFDHMLTVARLTYLLLLEQGERHLSKELAYAAGLLHDIGRWQEYSSGGDHARQSAELAEPILKQAGFDQYERELVLKAIAEHRLKNSPDGHFSRLSKAIRQADLLSRPCFRCAAFQECRPSGGRLSIKTLSY